MERKHQKQEKMTSLTPLRYLSPIDCFIPPQYVRQTLCFPGKGAAPILTLRKGLERTVARTPHLSTDVIPSSSSSHTPSPQVFFEPNRFTLGPPNHYGIDDIFSQGSSDLAGHLEYEHLKRTGFANNLLSKDIFLPSLPHFPASDGAAPAFRVRATQITNGIVVGVCWHHSLTDLGGIDTIFKLWAYFCNQYHDEVSSNLEHFHNAAECSSYGPVVECDRRLVCAPPLGKEPVLPVDIHVLDAEPPTLTSEIMSKLPLETVHFRISAQIIQDMKARLQKHLPMETRLSSNDVICAMMWSATTHAMHENNSEQSLEDDRNGKLIRAANPEAKVSMGLSVDMRQRLDPQIPKYFIGNAVAMAWPSIARVQLLEASQASHKTSSSGFVSLAQVASCIRKSQESLQGDYFRNLVAYLEVHSKETTRLQWGPGPTSTNMVAATWRDLSVVNLGWPDDIGECAAVRTRLPFPHTITILPQTAGTQGVDVAYCLLATTMQKLRRCKIITEYWEVLDGEYISADMSKSRGESTQKQ